MRGKTLIVAGTRPELIKVAPVVHELDRLGLARELVLTGQHGTVMDPILTHFGLTPDVRFPPARPGGSLSDLFAHVLGNTGRILDDSVAAVVVQGDTTSAAAAAVGAFNARIPVVHLEAGLRTGDLSSPFPEEGNRKIIGQIASLHLAPTHRAASALLAEGVKPDSVLVTGNTVVDALLHSVGRRRPAPSVPRADVLITAHRRESWGRGIRGIADAVLEVARERRDVSFLWVVHPNPAVRSDVQAVVGRQANVRLSDPLDYPEMVAALADCRLVLTDSGGLQEEAPSLNKPVLVTRDKTERPEAVEAGCARLVGTDPDVIVEELTTLLSNSQRFLEMSSKINPYGDGTAGIQSVRRMKMEFSLSG